MSLFRNGIPHKHLKAWSNSDFIKSLKNVQPVIYKTILFFSIIVYRNNWWSGSFFFLLSYTAPENMLNINVIFITQPKGVHKHFEEVAEHVSAEDYF